jgi:hypothetical protein
MNAALSRLMKKRSPRVVGMGKNPLADCVGLISSQAVIVARATAMQAKKIAVCGVHAIQFIFFAS